MASKVAPEECVSADGSTHGKYGQHELDISDFEEREEFEEPVTILDVDGSGSAAAAAVCISAADASAASASAEDVEAFERPFPCQNKECTRFHDNLSKCACCHVTTI